VKQMVGSVYAMLSMRERYLNLILFSPSRGMSLVG
jgi:hypothetical protein